MIIDDQGDIWDRVRRLMQGIKLSDIDRESRFSNKFDQFTAEAEESLTSVYNRFLQLINDLQRNNVKLPNVTINTKFLNCLKPEWYKYVTNVRLAKNLKDDSYDMLFDHLQQYEKLVIAFRAKRTAKTYDPLTYMHPTRGYIQVMNQDDNLTSIMMPLTRAITQRYSTLTNNRLRTSSNTRNQAVVKGNATNVLCYNYNAKCHYARNCLKPRVQDSKYFMEQMLLAKKDEVRIEELSANICMMAIIQQANTNSDERPSYDAAFISEKKRDKDATLQDFDGAIADIPCKDTGRCDSF
ncbi:hypothetical protein Tco_1106972 [Tanacetum coccineum]